jgi:hypothetical protein
LVVGVRPVSGFAELEGREGPEEDGAIGAELGGRDDLAGGGGGLTARCAVPFTFGFVFELEACEGPVELGRWGDVVARGGGGGNIGLGFGELAGGLAVLVFVVALVLIFVFVFETEEDPGL